MYLQAGKHATRQATTEVNEIQASYKNRNDRKSRLEFLHNAEIEVNKFREEELSIALKKF